MPRVKICGFTQRKDIEGVLRLGIKIIGINFYTESPRYVALKKAKGLLKGLTREIISIGVFVNPSEKILFETADRLDISGIQLHGNEPPSLLERFKEQFPEKILIKAIRAKDANLLLAEKRRYNPDFFLVDAYSKSAYGGTGRQVSLRILRSVILPWNKIFIAGGITPENATGLLKEFNPYGLDVASGVEIMPGIKDMEKIRKLLENIE